MIRNNDVLKLRVDGPIEIAQHKDNAPGFDTGYIPLELRRRESVASVTHWSNGPIIQALFQTSANTSWTHTTITRENKLSIKPRVRERSALSALERLANILSFRLASGIPGITKHTAVLIQPTHLQASAHRPRPLCVISH